jgi:hypothetical protein
LSYTARPYVGHSSDLMPLLCRSESICCVCITELIPGSLTRPLLVSDDREDLGSSCAAGSARALVEWCHRDCVHSEDNRIPLCKHFLSGKCLYADSCAFRHDITASHNSSLRARPRRGVWQRRKIYNEGKAAAVRRWMLDTFGVDYLQSGTGVLDVAGGKGELSFELLNLNGIPATVVDPRPLRLYRYKRKLSFGYYYRNDALGKYNSQPEPLKDSPCRIPRHVRGFFEVRDKPTGTDLEFCYPSILAGSEAGYAQELERGRQVRWTEKGLEHEEEAEVAVQLDTEMDEDPAGVQGGCQEEEEEEEVLCFEEARSIIAGCSVVVGLHPDQATEHIVDFCLANGRPFVVVPCCVYGKMFPSRRHPSGRVVSDYADLVEYLLSKNDSIRALELDFEGKNVLLYYLAETLPLRQPGA